MCLIAMRLSGKEIFMIYDLQKASMWKRISAFLFDAILLGIVAVLCAFALSGLLGYNRYAATVNDAYTRYSEQYGIDMKMSAVDYNALPQEQKDIMLQAFETLNANQEATHALGMMMELSVLIASFGLLLGFMVMEFVIPLLLKNGQTLGKKIFGIAVMHTSGIRLSAPMLFARTVLGKYAVETMVPVYILLMLLFGNMGMTGLIVLLLLVILQAVVLIATHTNSCIHDLLAKTVTVDFASQMIFETKEDLLAYKQKVHAQKAAKAAY